MTNFSSADSGWQILVSQCDSLQAYVNILQFLEQDQIFTEGRKLVYTHYSECVCFELPEIAKEIKYIFSLFLLKNFSSSSACAIQ